VARARALSGASDQGKNRWTVIKNVATFLKEHGSMCGGGDGWNNRAGGLLYKFEINNTIA
jgi:hypothetical protein